MARDIAFVAEKDTPEDGLPPGDPVSMSDGPRSEGSEAARARPAEMKAYESPTPASPEPATTPENPDEGADEARLPDAARSPIAPLIENIEERQPDAPEPSLPEAASDPSPPPAAERLPPDAPSLDAPSSGVPPREPDEFSQAAAEPTASSPSDSAAFEAAAEGLFRPPASDTDDDPHLITTGRKFRASPPFTHLDPVLAAPEPQPAPVRTLAGVPLEVWKQRILTGLRYAAYAVAIYLVIVLLLIVLFRFVNPPGSMLMLTKRLGGTAIDRTWVPLEAVAPALIRSVIVAEDSRFCAHSGIDVDAMRLALEQARRGAARGASTISMQVTKNLFLWNAKSFIRKVIEIPLTLVIEVVWPKQRIVEVYLNIAEWGPGVFGAEAAARHHFDKPASKLSEREAALLAAALPNPHVRVAGEPGPRTARMARVIQTRVRAFGSVAQCVVPRARATASTGKASSAGASGTKGTPGTKSTSGTSGAGTAARAKTPPPKKPPEKMQAKQVQPQARPDDWGTTLRVGPQ